MSDLTITQAGVAYLKNSAGEFLTADKKLNQMRVNLVKAELTTLAGAISNNEVVSQGVTLSDAVSVNGGHGIIQSITLNNADTEMPVLDLVFTQVSTAIADNLSEAVGNNVGDLDDTLAAVLGVVTIADWSNLVDSTICTRINVGLVIKAAEGSRDIYVHAINRSGADFTPTATDDLYLRVGIVQD